MSKRRYFLLRLFLLLASPLTLAQDRFSSSAHPDESRMPTGEDIAKAQTRARDAMARIPPGGAQQQHGAAAMPRIESLPKPAAPAPDIATLAEKYKTLGRAATANDRSPDLLVMVSLSMPREALERIADQAERAGATLVFRGLKGDSMTKMGTEIKTIVGNRNVSAVVHSPAFQQFSVTRVPAVVIARPEAGNVLDNGCSQAETFVKVSGDVSLDYALEYIERRSQTWAETAKGIPKQDRKGDQLRRVVAILMLCWAGATLADMGGSFQEGKNLGGSVAEGAFAGINSGAAEAKVPAYGANPAETQYYQGGQGQIAGPGIGKTQECAGYAPGSDKIANQECEAVNFLARNPQIRPQFNITKNDPMVLGAKNARNSAEGFFQSIGINGGTGSSTQCTTKTETTPAQYTTETCSSLREVGTQQCTMGRTVNIDTDANFQCDQTVNAYENLSCDDSTLACTVTGVQLQCASTSTLCASWASSCCWINVTCNAGGSATVQHGDCCGYSYTKVVSDVSQFLSGVTYNPAGAKITCTNTGSCSMTFENYYCSNPSASIGHYDNVNSFNMTTSPVFSCTEGGGCEALDARTR